MVCGSTCTCSVLVCVLMFWFFAESGDDKYYAVDKMLLLLVIPLSLSSISTCAVDGIVELPAASMCEQWGGTGGLSCGGVACR